VVISDLTDETFHARLFVERDGHVGEIDARPSDALALAVRVGAPIFAVPSVLDQAGLGADGGIGDNAEEGGSLESTGGGPVDPRLDVFRDFVNSLDMDPDAGDRGS
jgi:bifunctional DNase/RNase